MTFSFVVSHRYILTCTTEAAAKRVLKNPRSNAWKVLVNSVTGYVRHFERVLLPLRTKRDELGAVVELKICYRRGEIHQCFSWSLLKRSGRVNIEDIHTSHFASCRKQVSVWTQRYSCCTECTCVLNSANTFPRF